MGIKLGNIDAKYIKVGSDDCKVYLGNTLLYPQSPTPPTPSGSCYEVISTPISSYSSTTYDSVFSWDDNKWYMKNNLDDYEEYGVYDIVEDIASATTYEGKLAVVDTTEYQYSGDSWVEVGTYESEETTFEINEVDEYQYQGVELSTTFKIPYSDVEDLGGYVNFVIYTQDNGELYVDKDFYHYNDEEGTEEGNVTDDGIYYYFSLPDTQSITIDRIEYYYSATIHIIAETKQVSVEYPDKDIPLGKVYSSVASMESDSCPTVGIGQCGIVGNNVYKFSNNEEWDAVNSFKFAGVYGGEIVYAIDCDSSSAVTQSETQPSYISSAITSAIIGDCATIIDDYSFQQCTSLTSVDISDSVTSIGWAAFYNCSGLTSITVEATTPPTLDSSVFDGSSCQIYVPSGSVDVYKAATNWSTYADRIQAIPNS